MERYGHTQPVDGPESDSATDWSPPGGKTGLEEPVLQLGLGDEGEPYPERPDQADCIYYVRTGFCGYGARCRFNHPQDRSLVVGAMSAGGEDYPERVDQPVCQYYMRTGTCKFGASCKYHHPRQGGGYVSAVVLNISGYPLRPGEKECLYYVKTGQCKFGLTCKFHHPQPTGIQVQPPAPGPVPAPASPPLTASPIYPMLQSPSVPSSQPYGIVAGNWPVARPLLLPGSYLHGPYGSMLLPSGMFPIPGWNPYPAPLNPVSSPGTQTAAGSDGGPVYGVTQLPPSASTYTGTYLSLPSGGSSGINQREHSFPERPGQPECQYYLKTGVCKFGSSCRYHHPPEWSMPKPNFILSPMGLPFRPGAALCTHYAQNGVCKFGPSCKFDHPMGALSYSPSASSLADLPVASYPVGSSVGILAPSFSTSNIRPKLNSGSNKATNPVRVSSSISTSSDSVGFIFSKCGPPAHLSVQQSGKSSTPSTGGSSTSHGGEVHTSN